ncbi:hypothetical protein FRACYDRAFT_249546 [Fragilariopsis cylindrus CCMP1102]|uniref:Ubiquitin-like domain-containing protein n=1 Tax=Fragilariopsis cylindrus CCMP1102 TaxID=635003 RepID=A0A1E7ERJ8_9STRA|nr:hypothetical protein FRACYDRAFT_249546 [Fragilariopsis cylindrus CCMP1102]|eukprot:OEU08650.1 hypothetical protein FRACYDRAFT_249546 [Fragilariopsis cylindrus CCMP1102]
MSTNTTTPADDDDIDKNVSSPVSSPVNSPVNSPVSSPVSSPINSPIARRKSSLTPPRPSKLSLRSLGDKKNARGTPTGGGGSGNNNFGSSRSSHHSRISIGSTGSATSAATGSNNPITNDIKLNILVHDKLPKVQKYNQFQRWKGNFLTKFDSYLCESGTIPAKIASEKLQTTLEVCLQRSIVLLKHIDNGDLSVTTGKKTVKASLSLKEFCNSLDACRNELQQSIPATKSDERRSKYTKFQIGSALIHSSFPQYIAMKQLEDSVQTISTLTMDQENNDDVLDKQQRELFLHYQKQVSRFCDVMADLDLYDIMMKCVEFFHQPPDNNDESDCGSEEITIFIQRYNAQKGQQQQQSENDDAAVLKTVKVDVDENETIANTVSSFVLEELGVPKNENKLTIRYGKDDDIVIQNPNKATLRDLGIDNGDVLTVEQQCIDITIHRKTTTDGKPIKGGKVGDVKIKISIEPMATLKELKIKIAESLSPFDVDDDDGSEGNIVDDQILFLVSPSNSSSKGYNGNNKSNSSSNNKSIELSDNDKSCADYGIIMGAVLDLKFPIKENAPDAIVNEEDEPIIIVDTKYGTMFSINHKEAITKGVVTPVSMNDALIFQEITTKEIDIERLKKSMLESPNLKVKPALVIEKMKIEDYDPSGAKDVQNMWGVSLKKTNKVKRGTEIFFVDLQTKSIGVLDRNKLLEMKFITVVQITDQNDKLIETLEEGERDQQRYDYYVRGIRTIFGIEYANH